MDVFDLVYQVRMDLEEARLSESKVQLYQDLAKRRLQTKISSLETEPDSGYPETHLLECPSSGVESLHLQMLLEEELKRIKIGQSDGSQAQTNGLVAFLKNLHEDLKEESRRFEILMAGKRCNSSEVTFGSARIRYDSRTNDVSKRSGRQNLQSTKKLITIQTILDNLSDAISHMKLVNSQARDEMTKLKEGQRNFKQQTSSLPLPLAEKKMTQQQDEGEIKERMNEQLLKLRMELDISQKMTTKLKQKLQDITQKRHTGEISSIPSERSLDDKTPLVQVPSREQRCLRIRELELQLRRMEYRAKNAEDCCDQLERDLNQSIVDYSINKPSSTSERRQFLKLTRDFKLRDLFTPTT